MVHLFLDSLFDACVDTVKLIPFLYITYLVMEWLERQTESRSEILIRKDKVGFLGPVFGALVGIVPQCGFSAAAASLFSGGVITIGTLLSVFLSTSDEMLPLFISNQVPFSTMFHILGLKVLIGMVSGLFIDLLIGLFEKFSSINRSEKHIHDLCEDAHCGCEEKEEGVIWKAAFIHTIQIILFVFIITFFLNLLLQSFGEENVHTILSSYPYAGVFLISAIGLIPNCASSIMITQLYLENLIEGGQMMAGLLVSAGVGLLVLFRTNQRHLTENIKITFILYFFGVFWGLFLTCLHIVF